MASLSSPTTFTAVPTAAATIATTKTLFNQPLFSKTTTRRCSKQTHRLKVSCTAAPDDATMQNVDRRNLLLGLGGIYSAANLPPALAVPITAPTDISDCQAANEGISDMKNAVRTKACCPPTAKKAEKAFVFPQDKTVRIRPPAHRASPEYVEKYKAAIQAMRDLPDDDPHSFLQQAKIHCAYCNGGYTQIASGFPNKELQIHNSWLFFPFHRWYLYFYERILGKLIDDPTFALPYWNWDNPGGMILPPIFETDGKKNAIFDAFRDANHLPPAIVDIDYNGTDRDANCIEQININLTAMYKQMIPNGADAMSFFGGVYVGGDDPFQNGSPEIGSIEAGCHTAIHRWVGDPRMPNNEDMGNFYSAGYDPVFYVHHANVDRLWKLWKDIGLKGHTEPTNPDWLNASYVFYDENRELVRVYNKDCVNLDKLKYDYEPSATPWLKSRPVARNKKSKIASKSVGKVKKVQDVKFPLKVNEIVKVLVKRPVKKRSKKDKEDAYEALFINGIKFDSEKFVKFDVYVNDEDDVAASSPFESEFAGSFAQLPHNNGNKMLMTSAVRFGITELLEDIDCEDDDSILVTLVPKTGCDDVTVAEIKVVIVPIV